MMLSSLKPGFAIFAAVMLFAASCAQAPERAFYYWKTAQAPTKKEISMLREFKVTKLYLHAFDIDENGDLKGISRVTRETRIALSNEFSVVPVVYIENAFFRNIGTLSDTLAGRIVDLVDLRWGFDGIQEFQADCDWTPSTAERYFTFIRTVRKLLPDRMDTVSVTIRLHQAKDRKENGVPPADRGMLMAYNLLNPAEAEGRSAILDPGVLSDYLPFLKGYPLPLDVALPAFSWVSQFEGKHFIGLIPGSEIIREIRNGPFVKMGNGFFRATKRSIVAGRTVEAGDSFFIDETSPEKTLVAAKMLGGVLPRARRAVSLFHLDEAAIAAFSSNDNSNITKIFTLFGNCLPSPWPSD